MTIAALSFPRLLGCTLTLGLLSACTTVQPPPLPFSLAQGDQLHNGQMHPGDHLMEVTVAGKRFEGFYIQANSTALSQGLWPRRGFPNDTVTNISSNAARAVMTAADGERLYCDFMFEGNRVLGECKSSTNASFQLLAPVR